MKQEYIGFAVLALVVVAGLILASVAGWPGRSAAPRDPAPVTAGSLTVSGAWVAAPIAGQPRTAAYLTLRNDGAADDRLTGVSTPAAGMAHMHRTAVEDGVARMESLDALILPAGSEVRFAPGGLHIMMMEVEPSLSAGDRVPLTLHFLEAGEVTVEAPVRTRAQMLDRE